MKRWMILPVVALAFALFASTAAHANHGGAQSPDYEPSDQRCEVAYVFHASCSIQHAEADKVWVGMKAAGVPTADGWHWSFNYKVVDNANDLVLLSRHVDKTLPLTWNFWIVPAPLPNWPTFGSAMVTWQAETHDATCLFDVVVGSGRTARCSFFSAGEPLVPNELQHLPV